MEKHIIEDAEINNRKDCLTYFADGQQITVTGQFYINDGWLEHSHIFDDGEELEIRVLLENTLELKIYNSNFDVFGWLPNGQRGCIPFYFDGIENMFDSVDEYIEDVKSEINNHFEKVNMCQLDLDLNVVRGEVDTRWE